MIIRNCLYYLLSKKHIKKQEKISPFRASYTYHFCAIILDINIGLLCQCFYHLSFPSYGQQRPALYKHFHDVQPQVIKKKILAISVSVFIVRALEIYKRHHPSLKSSLLTKAIKTRKAFVVQEKIGCSFSTEYLENIAFLTNFFFFCLSSTMVTKCFLRKTMIFRKEAFQNITLIEVICIKAMTICTI